MKSDRQPFNNARRPLGVALGVLAIGLSLAPPAFAAPASAPRPTPGSTLAPPTMPTLDQPAAGELQKRIDRLSVVGSVLYIAAHPDDENTRLIAWLVGQRGLRTAYLSMTRGGGGQNLIGTEQAELLDVVRTAELLAARSIDGAEQRFTRMRDFGYSKNPEETLAIWGHDEALADVVWTVRSFRPDVIITRFDTAGPNHGHHTASALLAAEAFDAAADATRFPTQLAFASAWKADRLLENKSHWRMTPETDTSAFIKAQVGTYDPLIGASYGEVAAHSRTMHKSQGFGAAPDRGPIVEYFSPLKGTAPAPADDLLAGLDLTWKRFAGTEKLAATLARAAAEFRPRDPAAVLPILAEAHALMATVPDAHWRAVKTAELEAVMLACAGLWLDATAVAPAVAAAPIIAPVGIPAVAPGGQLPVTLTAHARAPGAARLTKLIGVTLDPGPPVPAAALAPAANLAGTPWTTPITLNIPTDHRLSLPHYLARPSGPARNEIDAQQLRDLPDLPGVLRATFTVEIAGRRFTVDRTIEAPRTDAVLGERRQPVEVLPPVTATFDSPAIVLPRGETSRVRITLHGTTGEAIEGKLTLRAPAGYAIEPATVPFTVNAKAPERSIEVRVTPRDDATPGPLLAEVAIGNQRYSWQRAVIDHDHLPRRTVLRPAVLDLAPIDLKRGPTRIGYLHGPGDTVAAALRQVGYTVEDISIADIAGGDLSRFDAIVTGIRAYNTHERLLALHEPLMAYVARGGRLIVQYNTNNRFNPLEFALGPWPFSIGRDRVTDENAAMVATNPEHPALTRPNRLTPADYTGWVQERGLYFAEGIDPRYESVFAINDPGETPLPGSLIVARHGKGVFVYTGLAFFRQLPAGVPGAFRLFANLMAL